MAVPLIELNNGVKMPTIGLGTWQMSRDNTAKAAVTEALKIGYRLTDTAMIYRNEEAVGEAIRSSSIPREEIFVTTKLWGNAHGHDNALSGFEDSLERLGLEYVDLYLVHWPGSGREVETWRAFEEMYVSGRAKSIGVSNFSIDDITKILDAGHVAPAVNQIEFHIFNFTEQKALLTFCQQKRIVVEAYSPLAMGQHMDQPIIAALAEKYQRTYAQVMLRWCIQHNTIPIPKSSNPQRQRENLDVFDIELSPDDVQLLDELSQGR